MNSKSIEKLEFNKIREILKNYTITYLGKKRINSLYPMNNKNEIEKSLKQVSNASIILYRKGSIPLDEIEDITEHIKKLKSSIDKFKYSVIYLTHTKGSTATSWPRPLVTSDKSE